MYLSYAKNRYLIPLNAKTEKELLLAGMYARSEGTLITVGNKRRIYSPFFECGYSRATCCT